MADDLDLTAGADTEPRTPKIPSIESTTRGYKLRNKPSIGTALNPTPASPTPAIGIPLVASHQFTILAPDPSFSIPTEISYDSRLPNGTWEKMHKVHPSTKLNVRWALGNAGTTNGVDLNGRQVS